MIRLSKHITDEMNNRGIQIGYIEAALKEPDREGPDPTDPALTRSFRTIPAFSNRVHRVVHRPDGDGGSDGNIFVVTAHWDRGAKPP
jgi:hypothetical protein